MSFYGHSKSISVTAVESSFIFLGDATGKIALINRPYD